MMKLEEIDLFKIDYGAPSPVLINDGANLQIIFYSDESFENGTFDFADQRVITLKFDRVSYHSMGPPNDEALNGHPYYELGLQSAGFYKLLNSELIERLNLMNRFHPYYQPNAIDNSQHYIITFKEKVFECVARGFEFNIQQTPLNEVAGAALKQLLKTDN